jgi:hypothetical protein
VALIDCSTDPALPLFLVLSLIPVRFYNMRVAADDIHITQMILSMCAVESGFLILTDTPLVNPQRPCAISHSFRGADKVLFQ